jgi:UDP-3-O-[3-hydroxymyristoyl] N-acetylglucosamine deacetylase
MNLTIPINQRTLKEEVLLTGTGLHTNEECTIRLLPGKPNTGIVFVSSRGIIGADLFSLGDSFSTTCLKNNGFYVEGVEHLLSAFYGMFLDNVEVEMYGPEIPQGDGSTWTYVKAIQEAGLVEQDWRRLIYRIMQPVVIRESDRYIAIYPCDRYTIHYSMSYPYPEIAHGEIKFTLDSTSYLDICKARTWAERSHYKKLYSMGRVQGFDQDSFIVIEDDGSIQQELRYEDETMRHKVLDCLGDLSLLYGMYIMGEVRAHNAGHKFHHALMKGLLDDSSVSSNRAVQFG